MKNAIRTASRLVAALGALLFSATSARAELLIRSPYVQSTTQDSTYIVWQTDVEVPSQVWIGSSFGNLNQVIAAAPLVTQHEVKISGLLPNTRYYYAVGSSGNKLVGGDAEHYFETNPVPGTKKKFRAWILGDSGDGSVRQGAVRDAMMSFVGAYRPQLFLHLGDMAYGSGQAVEFTSHFFGPYAKILQNTTCWPTMGNHEGMSSDSGTQTGTYYDAYVLPKGAEAGGLASGTEAYYSFDYANVHFIVLDSHDSPRTVDGAMLTWLRVDLSSTNQEWIVAYWHHPPYSKGTHDSDLEYQLIEMRANALPILEAGGVDLVLAGHSHIYERSYLIDGAYGTPTVATGHIVDSGDGAPLGKGPYAKSAGNVAHDGTVYVVAGHGGAVPSGLGGHPVMYFDEVDNGSCLLDVQENRLSLLNVRWDGVVSDRFALVKGTGIVVAAPDGGETLEYGTTFDMRWATVGNIPDVKIEYASDDGKTYSTITASTPNTGTYTWTVPPVDSKRAIVRVSDAKTGAIFDESNAGFTLIGGVSTEVIAFGATWAYSDQGINHGTAWRDVGFNDATWKSGKGQFGYGDGDETTTLVDASPNYTSVYFRKKIMIDRAVTKADLSVLHDDGVVVWINGKQVFSEYVGDTSYAALALAQSADNEVDNVSISMNSSPFVVGENVIAAMVKQITDNSPDLSFDLALTLKTAVSNESGAGGNAGTGGNGQGGKPLPGETGFCAYGPARSADEWMPYGFGLIFAALLRRRKTPVT